MKKKKFPIWDSLILGGIVGVMSVFLDEMIEILIFSVGFGILWGIGKAYLIKKNDRHENKNS